MSGQRISNFLAFTVRKSAHTPHRTRYKCVDAKRRKNPRVESDILVSMRRLWLWDYKIAVPRPLETICSLLHSKTAKKICSNWIVDFEPQLLWTRPFDGNLGKLGIVEFSSWSNWWVSVLLAHGDVGNMLNLTYIRISNVISAFEKLGLEVDNPARTSSNSLIVASIVYG